MAGDLRGRTKGEVHGLRVADVEVAIWFGRETGHDAAACRLQVSLQNLRPQLLVLLPPVNQYMCKVFEGARANIM
jgi:hypothetical protein